MNNIQRNNVEFRVLIKGKPIVQYAHNGNFFVEGRAGSNFELEIINRNPFRIEAVISVDGLSVIDGKEAGVNSAGYLVEGNSTVKIPGWKVNESTIAAFEFTGKDGSYSTGVTGSSLNNGVIGVMAFKDKSYRPPLPVMRAVSPIFPGQSFSDNWSGGGVYPQSAGYHGFRGIVGASLSNAVPMGAGSVHSSASNSSVVDTYKKALHAKPERRAKGLGFHQDGDITATLSSGDITFEDQSLNNLGTGFGEAQEFKTTTVQFERGDLQAMLVIYYDNARGLKARGIEVGRHSRTRHTATTPQAFPAMNCQPPAGWKG